MAMRFRNHPRLSMGALIARIQPSELELNTARLHMATVRARLQATYPEGRMIVIGSHPRGTAISGVSDIDGLFIVPRDSARWGGELVSSRTVMARVRESLQARFQRTGVRGDQQAVVVEF